MFKIVILSCVLINLCLDWQPGEPDGGSDENCVAMDWRGGSWDDLACNQDHETICQIVLKNI